jgi:hypothetical protein
MSFSRMIEVGSFSLRQTMGTPSAMVAVQHQYGLTTSVKLRFTAGPLLMRRSRRRTEVVQEKTALLCMVIAGVGQSVRSCARLSKR